MTIKGIRRKKVIEAMMHFPLGIRVVSPVLTLIPVPNLIYLIRESWVILRARTIRKGQSNIIPILIIISIMGRRRRVSIE